MGLPPPIQRSAQSCLSVFNPPSLITAGITFILSTALPGELPVLN